MVHIAVVGTGRVGGEVAYTLIFERYVTELSLADIAPKVAEMTKEELHHAIASHGFDIKINAYEDSKQIHDANLIVIAAGFPRTPEMSRRDLATKNATIVKKTVEDTFENNPEAWYFVISNPVDAMATVANETAQGQRHVIGTGTNLETSRFRTILSRELQVPIGMIEAYVGGEHGEAAVPLWSIVKVDGLPLDNYLLHTEKTLDKAKCENYVKEVSREIIRALGGTRYGPAGSFVEIIRGIMLNTGKIVSYSRQSQFKNTPEPVYITVPARIARSQSPDLWDLLSDQEKKAIKEAARIIYDTYLETKGDKTHA
jgi:malate dehydrogenase